MKIERSKYLVSPIHYKGLQRIEELEYPEEGLGSGNCKNTKRL